MLIAYFINANAEFEKIEFKEKSLNSVKRVLKKMHTEENRFVGSVKIIDLTNKVVFWYKPR